MNRHPNRLAAEKSPYLLQHAHNPVDWLPWGEEAFRKARADNKPLFLSIGYSTCHWCHVMERECFEDEETAALLNSVTVPVKIDREERPDLDGVYMTACQLMTGSGGWPLSIFADHQGRPFFAATYIPKHTRFGRMGLMDLLPRISEVWNRRAGDVEQTAGSVTAALKDQQHPAPLDTAPGPDVLDTAYRQLAQRFDAEHGGFGQAPKFPSPHQLLFLLRHHKRTNDRLPLDMVAQTLTAMRLGGIFDHVGLGFHRYSTGADWLLPHFEKMLYDQAMLLMAYTEGHQATGDPLFKRAAMETAAYVTHALVGAEGGFHSAEDADSEGEEGKFYVWTEAELADTLSPQDAAFYAGLYGFKPGGNFAEEASGQETGSNIPHLSAPPRDADEARLESIRQKLFEAREKRVHPHKDDKILTDWNGLMVAALAQAGRILDAPKLVRAASRAADFVLARLRGADGRLLHRYRDGEAKVPGNLDDHAFLAWGFVELYQATFDLGWLQAALDTAEQMLAHFKDPERGGFFFTADDAETVLTRRKDAFDAAMPSGNSVAMLVLLKLSRLAARYDLAEEAHRLVLSLGENVTHFPSGFTMLLCGLDFALGPGADVVLSGPDDASLEPFLAALRGRYLPNTLVLKRDEAGELASLASYTAGMCPVDGKATAYVCRDGLCEPPTTDVVKMMELLEKK
ncbi:thioredoxin domain-containing protein [Fundidesulfovibrio terrae]|uniref:thioredoxin domain-containing protein n=1 Tax=Fundidesulfovibrio terrae TaxID=2922866 RepID=UPI001FAEA6B0|nr:thioredoxin domain-containing protein [Fundidesulfovibrio terrae]